MTRIGGPGAPPPTTTPDLQPTGPKKLAKSDVGAQPPGDTFERARPGGAELFGNGVSAFTTGGSGGITQQSPVAKPLQEGLRGKEREDLLTSLRTVQGNPSFQKLTPSERKTVLDGLSSNPPVTAEKVKATLDLLGSPKLSALSAGDRKLALEGLRAGKMDPAYATNLQKLIENPSFAGLVGAEKTAVLSQTKNYPDPRSVANIDRMIGKDWFQFQDLADKQRSLKTVGRLSQHDGGDRKIIDNTLEKFLGPAAPYGIVWKRFGGEGITFGEADNAAQKLELSRDVIRAGNGKMPENEDTDRLSLNTVPHEVNHLIHGDTVEDDFAYFEDEYRAWYVGFQTQNGRVPSAQEAMEQRIRWQLDPESFYGKHAAEAMKNPAEAQKFFDFLSQVTGMKVDAANFRQVVASDPVSWPNLATNPAPVPPGNIDNS